MNYRVCLTDKMITVKQCNYNNHGVKGESVATTALHFVWPLFLAQADSSSEGIWERMRGTGTCVLGID